MKLKSSEEFVKYVTEKAVGFIATPREARKAQRSKHKMGWRSHWFGMLPFAIQMWRKRSK